VNVFGFQANYLDLFLSFISAVLAIFAGVLRRKYRYVATEFERISADRSSLAETHKALGREHSQLAVRFRTVEEERSRLARELEAANRERSELTILGKSVAEVLSTHKHGPMIANAIRAVTKRKGVLPEFEALLSSAVPKEGAPSGK
jgi:hypothetical protein